METITQLKELVTKLETELTSVHTESFEKPFLYDTKLTASQRVLLGIMIDTYEDGYQGCKQSSLVRVSGFSNKGVREMLEILAEHGYVKRGIKAGSWELA